MNENQQTTPELEPKKFEFRNLISEFLWLCAGVNRPVLRQCPTEYAKYAGIGGTILFTALMAMLSGGYAFYTVFDDKALSVGFGIFWGLLIFNLDRFIANTMYSDGKATISLMELASGAPRIVMAIFLGIVISTPLELKIFGDEIEVTIGEMKQEKIREYRATDEGRLDSLRKVKAELLTSNFSTPITGTIESMKQELEEKKNTLFKTQGEITNLTKNKNNEAYNKKVAEQKLSQCKDSYCENKYNEEIKKINNRIYVINKAIEQKKKDETFLNNRIDALHKAISSGTVENTKLWEKQIASIDTLINELSNKLNGTIAKEYEELVNKQYGGFQAHLSAFNKMKDENESTRISSIFIMLLFIIIETAPTFFKMMMETGPYDELLAAEEHRIKVLASKQMSDINDEVNTAVRISTARNKERLAKEIQSNEELLKELATTQSELLQEAIKLWREEELKKIKDNPSMYFSFSMPEENNNKE